MSVVVVVRGVRGRVGRRRVVLRHRRARRQQQRRQRSQVSLSCASEKSSLLSKIKSDRSCSRRCRCPPKPAKSEQAKGADHVPDEVRIGHRRSAVCGNCGRSAKPTTGGAPRTRAAVISNAHASSCYRSSTGRAVGARWAVPLSLRSRQLGFMTEGALYLGPNCYPSSRQVTGGDITRSGIGRPAASRAGRTGLVVEGRCRSPDRVTRSYCCGSPCIHSPCR